MDYKAYDSTDLNLTAFENLSDDDSEQSNSMDCDNIEHGDSEQSYNESGDRYGSQQADNHNHDDVARDLANLYSNLSRSARTPCYVIRGPLVEHSYGMLLTTFGEQLRALLGLPEECIDDDEPDTPLLAKLYSDLIGERYLDSRVEQQCRALSMRLLVFPESTLGMSNNEQSQTDGKNILINIKKNLEQIYILAHGKSAELKAATASTLKAMFEQFNVCISGVQATLEITKSDLMVKQLPEMIAQFYLDNIEKFDKQFITDYAEANYYSIGQPFPDELQIHSLIKFIQIAHEHNFDVSCLNQTHAIKDFYSDTIKITTYVKEQFLNYLHQECSHSNVFTFLLYSMKGELDKYLAEMDIHHDEMYTIKYKQYDLIKPFLCNLLKKYGILSANQTDLPATVVEMNSYYDQLCLYTIVFAAPQDGLMPNTIYIHHNYLESLFAQDYDLCSYNVEFLYQEEDITRHATIYMPTSFIQSLEKQPDNLIAEIAKEHSTVQISSLPFLLKAKLQKLNIYPDSIDIELQAHLKLCILPDNRGYDHVWIQENNLVYPIQLATSATINNILHLEPDLTHMLHRVLNKLASTRYQKKILDLLMQSEALSPWHTQRILFWGFIHSPAHIRDWFLHMSVPTELAPLLPKDAEHSDITTTTYLQLLQNLNSTLHDLGAKWFKEWLDRSTLNIYHILLLLENIDKPCHLLAITDHVCKIYKQNTVQGAPGLEIDNLFAFLMYRLIKHVQNNTCLLKALAQIFATGYPKCGEYLSGDYNIYTPDPLYMLISKRQEVLEYLLQVAPTNPSLAGLQIRDHAQLKRISIGSKLPFEQRAKMALSLIAAGTLPYDQDIPHHLSIHFTQLFNVGQPMRLVLSNPLSYAKQNNLLFLANKLQEYSLVEHAVDWQEYTVIKPHMR